jgi:hypothetical protein
MAKQTFTTGQVLTAAQMTSLQETAMTGGPASTKTVSYVLVAADAGTRVAMNAAGSTTITVNTGLFSAGDTVSIQNIGAGVCTVTAGTATVNTSGSLVLAQYQGGILYFTSASAAIFFQFATPASGDIEGVTAGTGISGGGTSGTVTITNSMATAIDAKGDLVVGTGADTFSRLAVGTNGYTLVADSAETTGLKWQAPAGGGGMTLINTGGTALTGASVTVSSIPGTYKHLYVVISDLYQATTLGAVYMRFNSDTGSNYNWSYIRNINVTVAGSNNTDTKINISSRSPSTNTAGKLTQVELSLPRYTDTTARGVHANAYMHDDTNPGNQRTDATYFGSAAISSITLSADYNFSGGTIYVYGVN